MTCGDLNTIPVAVCNTHPLVQYDLFSSDENNIIVSNVTGVFVDIAKIMIEECCGIDAQFEYQRYETNSRSLIENSQNEILSFPITKTLTDFMAGTHVKERSFIPLIESTGFHILQKTRIDVITTMIWQMWPCVAFISCIGMMFGPLLWSMDENITYRPESTYFKAFFLGIHWVYTTLTYGFGKRTPVYIIGMASGIIWITGGAVFLSLISADMYRLVDEQLNSKVEIRGANVGVTANSPSFLAAHAFGAKVTVFDTYESLLIGIESNDITYGLADLLQIHSNPEIQRFMDLSVADSLNYPTLIGIQIQNVSNDQLSCFEKVIQKQKFSAYETLFNNSDKTVPQQKIIKMSSELMKLAVIAGLCFIFIVPLALYDGSTRQFED